MSKFRLPIALFFFAWVGFILATFFVIQRPLFLQVSSGLVSTTWSLVLTAMLLTNSACLGGWVLRKVFPFLAGDERLLLGTGLGLGVFGLLGFGLAALGIAQWYVLLSIQVGLLVLSGFLRWRRYVHDDLAVLWASIHPRPDRSLRWIPVFLIAFIVLAGFLALAPPVDSFDALAYHLAVPSLWLRNGGLSAPDILPSYWFPGLGEGLFAWCLGLGSETSAQLLHLSWGILTALLTWTWVNKVWGNSVAWRSLALMVAMPSLPLIASWAYTDLILCFFVGAVLYLTWRSLDSPGRGAWVLAGVFCGMAMGVKYASFVLPLTILAWIAWTHRRQIVKGLQAAALFASVAVLTACPWYIRNWIWMENPVYPFLFGGKYWDAFRSAHFSFPGTGIGFNLLELIQLPFTVTFGYQDYTYHDGRIGPLWLILLPVCLWTLWRLRREDKEKHKAIIIPVLFGVVSLGAWVIGVINTSALWQARYLFPSLLMLSPLAALAWDALSHLDTPRLRMSFVFNILVMLFIGVNLLDFGLFVLARNPLAVAVGIEPRQAYYERFQSSYADALELVDGTPPEASIYFLYEPRSYGMERSIQVDLILDNLGHDFYLYRSPEGILEAWAEQGYSHVLYQRAGDPLLSHPEETARLFSLLEVVSETSNTVLYRLPVP